MKRGRGDDRTMDLLSWQPPAIVASCPADEVRADSMRGRLARAVALVLRESSLSREEIAARMGEFLGEECTVHMLDAYASQARENHTMSAIRLAALAHATNDARAFDVLVEPFGHAVIPARYLGAIKEAILVAKMEELRQEQALARRSWKGAIR